MALSAEERNDYHELIQTIFGGTVSSTPGQITEEVADIVDHVIDEIYECSKGMAIAHELLELWFPAGSLRKLNINAVKILIKSIQNLMDVEQGKNYTICINTARVKWKSALAIALTGL